jgi:hypothetical protein
MSRPTPIMQMPAHSSVVPSSDRRRTPMVIRVPGKISTALRLSHIIDPIHRCQTPPALSFNPPTTQSLPMTVHQSR